MATQLTSASGFISLLQESEAELKSYALRQLDAVVPEFWAEIAPALPLLEQLWEDEHFESRRQAALVVSKVLYHLEDYDASMRFALHAGAAFDVNEKSQYAETIIAKAIDEYVRLREEAAVRNAGAAGAAGGKSGDDSNSNAANNNNDNNNNNADGGDGVSADLLAIVTKMFDRCFADKQYKQALGIAIESRRLDILERAITESPRDEIDSFVQHAVLVAMKLVDNRDWRSQILRRIVKIYGALEKPNYVLVFDILVHLKDTDSVAETLHRLLKSNSPEDTLTSYQLAFDLCTSASQQFLRDVKSTLPLADKEEERSAESEAANDNHSISYQQGLRTLRKILEGDPLMEANMQFLYWADKTDLAVLNSIKDAVSQRDTVNHAATIFCNALMHAGTTRDTFLRTNLEWLARATHWARFTAAAGLGVIHKGHLKEAKTILAPYLPNNNPANSSAYSEGGALFALGIIHANHGDDEMLTYILDQLKLTHSEIVQHGACLGLGLVAMGTGNDELYEELKSRVLYTNDAVSGEAAGIAMGLVMLGTGKEEALEEMLTYAHQTNHEKIIRGLSVGIALIMFGREEGSDALVARMLEDKDPIIRYGACYTLGLAFAGTGNNRALRKLLHVAVSDVADDVRRAATINIGFILFNEPQQVPKMLSLLSKSYNPHVRYGAALAVGISCAGTGLENIDAILLLESLLVDKIDYVRQGAMIGLSMVLIQCSSKTKKITKEEHLAREAAEAKKAAALAAASGETARKEKEEAERLAKETPKEKKQREEEEKKKKEEEERQASIRRRKGEEDPDEIVTGNKEFLFRKHLMKTIKAKYTPVMTRFGAILSHGILDAGGRNVTLSIASLSGHKKIANIVGLSLFSQYWYWHPMIHFISLAFTPTAIIAMDSQLRMPEFNFKVDAPPSTFTYPDKVEEKTEKKTEKVKAAVLSVTKKAEKREMEKKKSSADFQALEEEAEANKAQAMELEGEEEDEEAKRKAAEEEAEKKRKAAEPEPTFEWKENPARITVAQLQYANLEETNAKSERYRLVRRSGKARIGVAMVVDTKPDEEPKLVKTKIPAGGAASAAQEEQDTADEPSPPAPFTYE